MSRINKDRPLINTDDTDQEGRRRRATRPGLNPPVVTVENHHFALQRIFIFAKQPRIMNIPPHPNGTVHANYPWQR